jgi:hypothetical protein
MYDYEHYVAPTTEQKTMYGSEGKAGLLEASAKQQLADRGEQRTGDSCGVVEEKD